MAANGDNNDNHDADEHWPFDPLMLPDDFDDVTDLLLHVPGSGGLDFPDDLYSPPAAPLQNVTTGSYGGNNPLDWTAVPGNGAHSNIDSSAPPAAAGTASAGPSATSTHQDVEASSSSYVHQRPLDCSRCQILRQVVHSKALETTKLCIHGAASFFYHATLEVYHVDPDGLLPLAPSHQSFIDFMGRDYAWVKHYLMNYAQQRAGGGYTIVHDSTSDFIDVLCTSMAGIGVRTDENHAVAAPQESEIGVDNEQVLTNAVDFVQPMIAHEEDVAAVPPETNNAVEEQEQQDVHRPERSRFAIQRERTRELELQDISRYFHLPMAEACKELDVCATVLKGLSRKFGITRWPYRKIKAIDAKIANLKENGNGSAETMNEIQKLTDSRRKAVTNDSSKQLAVPVQFLLGPAVFLSFPRQQQQLGSSMEPKH